MAEPGLDYPDDLGGEYSDDDMPAMGGVSMLIDPPVPITRLMKYLNLIICCRQFSPVSPFL